jgi:hypothetical protein
MFTKCRDQCQTKKIQEPMLKSDESAGTNDTFKLLIKYNNELLLILIHFIHIITHPLFGFIFRSQQRPFFPPFPSFYSTFYPPLLLHLPLSCHIFSLSKKKKNKHTPIFYLHFLVPQIKKHHKLLHPTKPTTPNKTSQTHTFSHL